MSRYYYRITVNEAIGTPTAEYPGDRWAQIAQISEDRGWEATLERQLLIDDDAAAFMAGLADPTGYVRLGDRVASPWEVLAEMRPRPALIVG